MVSSKSEVIVVGGGIVGASAAFYLARSGVDVSLLEKSRIGERASTAAAGALMGPDFVSPDTPLEEMNSFARLNRASRQFYPAFFDDLEEATGTRPELYRDGGYRLAFGEEQREEIRTYCREMAKYDRPVQWLSESKLRETIPGLGPSLSGGFYVRDDCWVEPDVVISTLRKACDEHGVVIREGRAVTSLDVTEHGSVSVRTDGNNFRADRVLMAAGAWTLPLLKTMEVDLPVYPRKGEMLRLRAPCLSDLPLVKMGDWFILPRSGRQALVGATELSDAGFNTVPTKAAHDKLMDRARTMIPALDPGDVVEQWSGLRPYADRKGGPYLGSLPDHDRVYVAAGHYKNGITQGPLSGKLVAESILGKEPHLDLEDYRPD
jgi:glycine oxidase